MLRILLLLLTMAASGACNCRATDATLAPRDVSAAAILRGYLSSPPCVERMVYTDYSSFVPQSKYVIAVNGNDYLCRQVDRKGDLTSRVSATNSLHPGLIFQGRSGALRWKINGFELRKSVAEAIDGAQVDPNIVLVDMYRASIDRVINFGPTRVLPGTFVWSGNEFHATADPIMTNGTGHPEFAAVRGMAKEENGRIIELRCVPFGGTFRYEYEEGSALPLGFPSRVSAKDPKSGKWIRLFEYHEVVLSTPQTINTRIFAPEYHVDPEFVVVTSRSNNVVTAKVSPTDERVVRLTLDQLGKEKSSGSNGFSSLNLVRLVLLLAFATPVLFLIFALSQKKPPPTENQSKL